MEVTTRRAGDCFDVRGRLGAGKKDGDVLCLTEEEEEEETKGVKSAKAGVGEGMVGGIGGEGEM